MPILQKSTVKDRFAEWERFCDAHPDLTADQALGRAIADADAELREYIPGLDSNVITEPLELRLMQIIRYRCFLFRHGDTEFDQPPAIVQDYHSALERLKLYRSGELKAPDTTPATDEDKEKDVHIQAKRREFDDWFTKRWT
jgi:phage gp36-like protein